MKTVKPQPSEWLGCELRLLRVEKGLTIRELAKKSGVAADTICQLENAHRAPRPLTLGKLARALETSESRLMNHIF